MAACSTQLNVRLEKEHRTVLDAAAFVHDTTAVRIVQELVERAVADYVKQPAVQKVLEARLEQAAVDAGKLAHLCPATANEASNSAD